ncbi:carbohydrate binding domain-containing protein [Planctomycetota bacterium]
MKNLFLVLLLVFGAAKLFATDQGGNFIRNGSFEIDTNRDGLSDQWRFMGDEGVVATLTRDKGFVDQFCQRLTCTYFTYVSPSSHVMLSQLNTVQLEAGMWYKLSFFAKQDGILSQTGHVSIKNTETELNSGLSEYYRVTSEWRQFEFTFQATETIFDNVRLQFWYNSIGTLWLDDVRLEPSEPRIMRFTEIVPLSNSVNLLPNSSFECGISGWGSIAKLPGWGGNLNLPVGTIDATTAQFHQSSYKIDLSEDSIPIFYFDHPLLYRIPVKAPLLANRGWFTVEPGANYTLSAYMKAKSDGLVGILSAYQASGENLQQETHLNKTWTRYEFTFQPQTEQVFIALGIDLEVSNKESGTVWIDGVQFEKNLKATPYQPRATVEVGLETDSVGNIFPYGVEPGMMATVFNSDEVSHSIDLHFETTDFDDVIVNEVTLPAHIPSGQTIKIPIHPGVQQKGFYRLHLYCQEAHIAMTKSLRFAIIVPYTKTDSLFGINHAYSWPHLLDLSKQIGIRWFRDWSLKWHEVEPEKGRFEFTQTDYQIDRVLERGLNALLLLPFPSNNWSSSANSEAETTESYASNLDLIVHMPRDLKEFATYVYEVVQHYKNRAGVWEILNEPINASHALPRAKGYLIDDYLKILQSAYEAVKLADPNAIVVGGIAGGPANAEEFIKGGNLLWADALNLHIFPGWEAPETIEEPLLQLREWMRAVGTERPIWFTEGAYYADDDKPFEPYHNMWLKPLDSEIEAAEWQVKFNTLLLTYGVEKIIYHAGTSGSLNAESLPSIFFEWEAAPRKMLVTQSVLANLLSPPIKPLGPIGGPEGLKAYGFETDTYTVIVAWAREGTIKQKISLIGKPWRIIELQGNELDVDEIFLTERPIYFITEGTMPIEFPW